MALSPINFSSWQPPLNPPAKLVNQVDTALTKQGFMAVNHLGVDARLLKQVFSMSEQFFSLPTMEKNALSYASAEENFGYQGFMQEHLDPTKPADAKEAFTLRSPRDYTSQANRWPSAEFRELMIAFYDSAFNAATRLLRIFASSLATDPDFFINCHSHQQNVTLRLLHYPPVEPTTLRQQQLGAGAHTDYGLMTLLFTDGSPGLEIRDSRGQWQSVTSKPDQIIINTGDLMERWTNNRYRSTLHRVQPQTDRHRYSIALFIDPDSHTRVSTLTSCISDKNPNAHSPVLAGDYIQSKIIASQPSG